MGSIDRETWMKVPHRNKETVFDKPRRALQVARTVLNALNPRGRLEIVGQGAWRIRIYADSVVDPFKT